MRVATKYVLPCYSLKAPVMDWYTIVDIDAIDSPALVLYEERIKENIRLVTELQGDVSLLRPHVKTHKLREVTRFMLDAEIARFKCATIAEAEMLAQQKAPDILLAYQPVGPKLGRFLQLIDAYPDSRFSCLVDNETVAAAISAAAAVYGIVLHVYIDLNTGMNRTGIAPGEKALALYQSLVGLPAMQFMGLHAYDGHINEPDPALRQQQSDEAFAPVDAMAAEIERRSGVRPVIIAGGSPTFPTHYKRPGVQCSPGTFVFWDRNYKLQQADLPFDYAAVIVSRVVSVIDGQTICTDLGHKSVAAESPMPKRVYFLNAPEAVAKGQSEEHLVLTVPDASNYKIGDVLYGVPGHICPSVALYESAYVISEHRLVGQWQVVARDRKINI